MIARGTSIVVALLFVASCRSTYAPAVEASRSEVAKIAAATKAPALAVAVVVNGRIVMTEYAGEARPDSQFRIGSVSKMLTSYALARLVGRGTIGLDDEARRYVPEFQHASTIRQLAMHTGGVRHYGPYDFLNKMHYDTVGASLAKFINDPLVHAPGEKYFYSSYGYNLLGEAMARAAGEPFPSLLQREVFGPLRMTSTTLTPDPARVTRFYNRDKDGDPVLATEPVDFSDRVPSGAYLSTAEDLARFLAAVVHLPEEARHGWRTAKDEDGRAYIHHGGQIIGGRAFVLAYPRERVGVVILANLSFAPIVEKEALAVARPFVQLSRE